MMQAVNRSIALRQNRKKLNELCGNFAKLSEETKHRLLAEHMFIREGSMLKQCRKTKKPRYFWLFSDSLWYGDQIATNLFTFHRALPLHNATVVSLADNEERSFAFQVNSSTKSFVVFAESEQQKTCWLADFAKLLGQGSGADKHAPLWIPDNKSTNCMICGVEFTLITRRHHCRNCGKIICGRCCSKRVLDKSDVLVCTFCCGIMDMEKAHLRITSPEKPFPAGPEGRKRSFSAGDSLAEPQPPAVEPSAAPDVDAIAGQFASPAVAAGLGGSPPIDFTECNAPHYLVVTTLHRAMVMLLREHLDPATVIVKRGPACDKSPTTVFIRGHEWAPATESSPQLRYSRILAMQDSSGGEPQIFCSTNPPDCAPIVTPSLFSVVVPVPGDTTLEGASISTTPDGMVAVSLPRSLCQPLVVVQPPQPADTQTQAQKHKGHQSLGAPLARLFR
eukprot:TRINITY_DN453_c2_g1_i2.p1 TRINITY_DN453_c2_g1~~TRINITY_DN453_c2_g1_i2.p1  ORF type:complete len:448 (+),score=88.74 TRINITY_DN453_c2_g1_i2:858-2201(+)